MPKKNINYSFVESNIVYDFYDVFVPAEEFVGRNSPILGWGRNNVGQLGITDKIIRSTPTIVAAQATNWVTVNSCTGTGAIKTDGTLWMWGLNTSGALGNNKSDSVIGGTSTPITTFAGGTNWKTISCGIYANAALKTDGSLWVWGTGSIIGINTTRDVSTPVTTFAGGTNWKQVSCGSIVGALKNDGTLWVWGGNLQGQLGTNDTVTRLTPVTTFAGGNNWKKIYCEFSTTAAIKTDGTLWMWGSNTFGGLGINDSIDRSTPVTTFSGGTNWNDVACDSTTLAVKTDGTLWTWGYNGGGTLGINNLIDRSTPVTTFSGGTNWSKCATKENASAAIKTDGTLWEWGINTGTNDGITRSTPVTTFAGGTDWILVSCGQNGFKTAIKLNLLYQGDVAP